ncbi:hypothetical protein BGZ83_000087 [Gryganskiella cystojenkinii]|nr:hypothetical protein BGZ83_000087 [Gryganskiella cystojenkinii]
MSNLQVNFTTHGHDLKAAYDAILRPTDPKNGDNWAIFGYDKGTNDLKVLNRGNGGLEELEEEFMDGKIQYAFARIIDPNSQLNKFVLIAWCGDGVPESKKGLFSSHLADVSNFLRGYHLQINARYEADVTPAQIMKRVNEGSGSKYSIHKETYEAERIRPLQSAYKKTEIPDIAALQRNPTKSEAAPKYNVGTKPSFGASYSSSSSPAVAAKPAERSWNSPVASAASTTSSSSSTPVERSWKTSVGSSYTAATGSGFNKIAPPASLLSYGQSTPNEPVVNKAQQMRQEREAREKEERERIKREITASEARERSNNDNQNSAQKQAEERRLQEQREREQEQQRAQDRDREDRVREERIAREKEERERAEAEDAARSAREAIQAREAAQARDQSAQDAEKKRQQEQQQREREKADREAAERREREHREQQEEEEHRRQKEQEEEERRVQEEEERRHLEQEEERRLQEEVTAATAQSVDLGADALLASSSHAQAVPGSVSAIVLYSYEKAEENEMSLIEGEIIYNVTELDVGWWSGESEDGQRSGLFPANYVEVIEHSHDHTAPAHHEEAAVHEHEAAAEESYHHQEPAARAAVDVASSGKPSAVALYDYNAGEPNEISFSEGDTLTDIEFVTEDWWSGRIHDGSVGLFPSNYVELHQ